MPSKDSIKKLKDKLADLKRDGEERLAAQRAISLNLSYVDLRKTSVSPDALSILSKEDAQKIKAIPLQHKYHKIALACVDPSQKEAQTLIHRLKEAGNDVVVFIASESGIKKAQEAYELVSEAPPRTIVGEIVIEKDRAQALATELRSLENAARVLGETDFSKFDTTIFIETVFAGGLVNRASDIHFEPNKEGTKIRYRIDGVLYDVLDRVPRAQCRMLLTRLKLVSGLKINVSDEPQGGRFSLKNGTKEIEVRASINPSEFGEAVVMRLLNPDALHVGLAGLGLRDDDLQIVLREIKKPNGLILNTGPTGSGKTTTLYTFLNEVNTPEVKIITVEDPIEYHLPGIEQTQVDETAGYAFVDGLRSILRQDPDVILIGEIRDKETAEIALQAALTGHLVFSTLHTNDAIGAAPRLVDLGVRASSLGPGINLIIAQRLVRTLCGRCKKPKTTEPELVKKVETFLSSLPARVNKINYEKYILYEPGSCDDCSGIGFRGRTGVYEFFIADEKFEEAIMREVSETSLRSVIDAQGMVTMQQDGILKVLLGTTTLNEVQAATGPLLW